MKASEIVYTQTNVKLCAICGKPMAETHHVIYGTSQRRLADEDGLTMPLCRDCHKAIHYNGELGELSKMFGQLMYEYWWMADFGDADTLMKQARGSFVERYGRSYL